MNSLSAHEKSKLNDVIKVRHFPAGEAVHSGDSDDAHDGCNFRRSPGTPPQIRNFKDKISMTCFATPFLNNSLTSGSQPILNKNAKPGCENRTISKAPMAQLLSLRVLGILEFAFDVEQFGIFLFADVVCGGHDRGRTGE